MTNHYEVPTKNFLPPYNYVQPTATYNHRKVNKYDIEPTIPLIVQTHPTNKRIVNPSYQKPLKALATNILKTQTGLHNKQYYREKNIIQINEVLDSLNANTNDYVSKPVGHGMNLKENMEALKGFVRPNTSLKALNSMVDEAITELRR